MIVQYFQDAGTRSRRLHILARIRAMEAFCSCSSVAPQSIRAMEACIPLVAPMVVALEACLNLLLLLHHATITHQSYGSFCRQLFPGTHKRLLHSSSTLSSYGIEAFLSFSELWKLKLKGSLGATESFAILVL